MKCNNMAVAHPHKQWPLHLLIECVVDTGSSRYVAKRIQIMAPTSAQNMPYMNTAGAPAKVLVFAMEPATALVTFPPRVTAPVNSKTAAMQHALQILRVLLPTEVPKALATSLAPAFQGSRQLESGQGFDYACMAVFCWTAGRLWSR